MTQVQTESTETTARETISLKTEVLDGILAAMKTASDDPTRYGISGVRLKRVGKESVLLVATNGHTLIERRIDGQEFDDHGIFQFDLFFRREKDSLAMLKAFRKYVGRVQGVELRVGQGGTAILEFAGQSLKVEKTENYPDYTQVIPDHADKPGRVQISLNPELLAELMESMGRDKRHKGVTLEFDCTADGGAITVLGGDGIRACIMPMRLDADKTNVKRLRAKIHGDE